uniref:DNA-binding protein inhibitor ID-2b n=1 Tax=Semicossyphus pulcher TaxID=241346 RepID=UPI0037E88545
MRAGSPVISAGRRRSSSGALSPSCRSSRCSLRGFSRNKSPAAAEEPQVPELLLLDMNLCYRLLRRLVPGLPPGRAASRVEILQHVIDYILDLQTELDASCRGEERSTGPEPAERTEPRDRHTHASPRSSEEQTQTPVW